MCTLCTLSLITCIISFCHQLSMLNSSSIEYADGVFLRRVFHPVYDVRPPCPLVVSTLGLTAPFSTHFLFSCGTIIPALVPLCMCLNPTPYGSHYLYEFSPLLNSCICVVYLFWSNVFNLVCIYILKLYIACIFDNNLIIIIIVI